MARDSEKDTADHAAGGNPGKAPAKVERLKDESTGDITERWTDESGQRWEKIIYGPNGRQKQGTHTTTKIEELRYFFGRFQPAGQPGDQQIVKVWYKGFGKQYVRGTLVIVPSTHLGVCGIANLERFKMEPGQPLKKLAPYNPYGFQVDFTMGRNGEATAEEYEKRIHEGTAANMQVVARGMTAAQ